MITLICALTFGFFVAQASGSVYIGVLGGLIAVVVVEFAVSGLFWLIAALSELIRFDRGRVKPPWKE